MANLLTVVFLTIISIPELMIVASPDTAANEAPASPSSPLPHPENKDTFSMASTLEPILNNLGFQNLAMAVSSLSSDITWTRPSTIFAPTDGSIRSCASCSIPRLLQEHTVPGIFTIHYLRTLAFGTKIETVIPNRCLTVTADVNHSKIFIGGVEITQPDLFNNGEIVVHGLQGFVSHLSPSSCTVERMTSLSFPPLPSESSVVRLMVNDVMLRLRISGFSILALALRMKFADLACLKNMTLFALDDASIFSGGQSFVSNVRFHIVPNKLLVSDDLGSLSVGTVLPTMDGGRNLEVTTAEEGEEPMRINYVRIKKFDIMHNSKIVVHSLSMPFSHLKPSPSHKSVTSVDNQTVDLTPSTEIDRKKKLDL